MRGKGYEMEWACRDYTSRIEMLERIEDTRWSRQACGSGYKYKEWGNMGCSRT